MCGVLDEEGQATVEYAVVAVALMAGVVALGALWRFLSGGGATRLIAAGASHVVSEGGGLLDVLLY